MKAPENCPSLGIGHELLRDHAARPFFRDAISVLVSAYMVSNRKLPMLGIYSCLENLRYCKLDGFLFCTATVFSNAIGGITISG